MAHDKSRISHSRQLLAYQDQGLGIDHCTCKCLDNFQCEAYYDVLPCVEWRTVRDACHHDRYKHEGHSYQLAHHV